MVSRRRFISSTAGMILAGALPMQGRADTSVRPRLSVWILRGGLDGLAAVVPWADPHYEASRRNLALARPGRSDGVLDLDGTFGLHPALGNLHGLYKEQQLTAIHAVATAYRERSHFDGQKILENGTTIPTASSGWLNRLLAQSADTKAMAISQRIPLLLRGDERVLSWAPSVLPDAASDTLARVGEMYDNDPFFAQRFNQALAAQALVADSSMSGRRNRRGGGEQFAQLTSAAAKFMRESDGPEITVLESNGWDTHANEGAANGQLANRLRNLDRGVARFRQEAGDMWDRTVILIVTEFGRTAMPNGTNGTDHGTAGVALLAGGAVDGGRVLADWPGLSPRNLYQNRDLFPTLDLRAICKGVLRDHFALSDAALNQKVFPDSQSIRPHRDLIRSA